MSRGDGTGRLISPPGADDSDTGILHIDMDAFYASVAVLDDPSLAGIPLIVGGRDGRAVVSSASYEARRYGVRSAMPVAQALRLCPSATVVSTDFARYQQISHQVMQLFETVTPLVEPLSIDEAFLDVRGVRRLWGSPGEIARSIRSRVEAEVGITCSIGVAATKHVAKMASTLCKPDGLLIIPGARTQEFLDPRSVRTMWGVGPKTAETLERRGIRTIRDVRETPLMTLRRIIGEASALRLSALARGEDAREVETERVEKSIGHEETFQVDVVDRVFLLSELQRLSDRVAARLRQSHWEAGGVAIKVRFDDFTTLTRSRMLPDRSSVGQRIGHVAQSLFEEIERHDPIRLIGVRAERLTPAVGAQGLWDEDADWRRVEDALDDAHRKFGAASITRARHVRARDGRSGVEHPKT